MFYIVAVHFSKHTDQAIRPPVLCHVCAAWQRTARPPLSLAHAPCIDRGRLPRKPYMTGFTHIIPRQNTALALRYLYTSCIRILCLPVLISNYIHLMYLNSLFLYSYAIQPDNCKVSNGIQFS